MKRLTRSVANMLLLALALSGCSGSSGSPTTSSPGAIITPTPAVAKIGLVLAVGGLGNGSYNDVIYEGVKRAVSNLGVSAETFEPSSSKDYDAMIGQMAQDGAYDLIIVASPDASKAVVKYADMYPKQKFVIVDAEIFRSNVKCIVKNYSEMTFLAGALCGLMTKENSQTGDTAMIGIIVDVKNELTEQAIIGFEAGARMENEDIEIKVVTLGSLTDKLKCKQAAKELYASGAQVIMCFAGEASTGAIDEAVAQGKYIIGANANQNSLAPNNIIASCMEVTDIRVYSEIERILSDTWARGVDIGALREGAVDLVFDGSNVSVSKDIKTQIEELKHRIVTRQIKVPSEAEMMEQWLLSVK